MKLDVGMLTHDLKTLPEYARKVEAMGYDCLWSSETQHDPYLPLGVAATVTSRIKLGTNIATVFSRSPMITAHIAWDLQKASGGRFTLGLGTQVKAHNERRFSVKFESPAPKMAEAIRAIRAIWNTWQTGAKLDFKGRFYTFDVMTPFFNPGPIEHPQIPIFIAAVNPFMCGVAGELCDGLHVHPFNSPKYLREVVHPAVEEGLRKSGRARKDFTYATSSFVVVGDTEKERAEQARMVKQQIAFYGSPPAYRGVLELHGWAGLADELNELSRSAREDKWAAMAGLIDDDVLNAFAVVAEPGGVAPEIQRRFGGLIDRVSFYPAYDIDTEAWDPILADLRASRG